MNIFPYLDQAQKASRIMALLSEKQKNAGLIRIAQYLRANTPKILQENVRDLEKGSKKNLGAMLDRLLLTEQRIEAIAADVEKVATLCSGIGEVLSEYTHPQRISIQNVRVPLGVVGMIYESRPNVTVDAAVLALKSGNAIVLKGGKEATCSNRVLVQIMKEALSQTQIPVESIQLLDGATRQDATELMHAKGKIDILIPRGSKGLIDFVNTNSFVPVIETGASVVHTFIDKSADLSMAVNICINEKMRRVAVCNTLDTILVHEQIYSSFLCLLIQRLIEYSQEKNTPAVKIHADKKSYQLLQEQNYQPLEPIVAADYDTEWLDYALSICVVRNLDEALEHIQKHSLGHSESIVTEDLHNAERFLNEVDAACVFHNVATCFADGAQFGLGAEIGISTQKLHVRGPFALNALTTTKWRVRGNGQIRE